MAGDASVHFRSYGGTLDEDIDQSVDAYASAIVHKNPNITDTAARVAIGEGFDLFIGLIIEDPSTALTEASKLSHKDWSTATTRGVGILFRQHGVTTEDALRSKLDLLEQVKDRLVYPEEIESVENQDEGESGDS